MQDAPTTHNHAMVELLGFGALKSILLNPLLILAFVGEFDSLFLLDQYRMAIRPPRHLSDLLDPLDAAPNAQECQQHHTHRAISSTP